MIRNQVIQVRLNRAGKTLMKSCNKHGQYVYMHTEEEIVAYKPQGSHCKAYPDT